MGRDVLYTRTCGRRCLADITSYYYCEMRCIHRLWHRFSLLFSRSLILPSLLSFQFCAPFNREREKERKKRERESVAAAFSFRCRRANYAPFSPSSFQRNGFWLTPQFPSSYSEEQALQKLLCKGKKTEKNGDGHC